MSGCKVCRVLESHDVEHYNDRLLEQWLAPKPQRKGYRKLARWLNVALLRRQMDRAGLPTLGEEAESKYDRLRGDDSTAAEVRELLSAETIDVDQLERDFVSYGVIRTHMLECLGAEREETTTDWEREAIDIAVAHASKKVEEAVGSLVRKGNLEGGSIVADVSVDVECEQCHTKVSLSRALRRGYVCDCGEETP